tara:strand:- start:353 stop:1015 length:663 start_codon:yes stop_codon:yes gene_type:complete
MNTVLIENELKNVFEKYRFIPNVEIEIRLGWYCVDHFDTNIGKTFYNTIFDQLSLFDETCKSVSNTEVYVQNMNRIVYDTDKQCVVSCHKKIKLHTTDIKLFGTPYDLRISVSVEKPTKCSKDLNMQKIRTRKRNRLTYKMWHYDLTKVESEEVSHRLSESCQTYEFELEFNPKTCNKRVTNLYLAKSALMKLMDIVTLNKHEKIQLNESMIQTYKNKRI